MRNIRKVLLAVIVLGALVALALPARAEVSAEDAAKIHQAAPDEPSVRPQQPRRLLVYSRCTGYRHGSIPHIIEALKAMAEKTGAFELVVSDDMRMFEADSLARFDAVFLNNTTGELFAPSDRLPEDQNRIARERGEQLRENLLAFVRSGKGLVGAHAATDCSYKWPAYGEMIVGYFNRHPWNQMVTVKIDEPNHPLTAPFEGQAFEVHDEIYQFRDPYARSQQRVLLSLDMARTPDKGQREDKDYAVSWVKPYGRGRVFYCSLGHRKEVLQTPAILAHYLAGVQYALGDLPADDGPSEPAAEEGFTVLFNGRDLTGWTQRKSPEEGGWRVENGAIAWQQGCGFLWSEQTYRDFVLKLQFRVSPGANSGVFVRTRSQQDWLHTGIEVQILDSAGKASPGRHDAGAVYDVMAPSSNPMKPAYLWNDLTITCRGHTVQVEMNGERIVDMDLSEWTEAHRNPDGSRNKFKYPYKDLTWAGYIGLQDHGQPVWFRNIRIQPLDQAGRDE